MGNGVAVIVLGVIFVVVVVVFTIAWNATNALSSYDEFSASFFCVSLVLLLLLIEHWFVVVGAGVLAASNAVSELFSHCTRQFLVKWKTYFFSLS